MIRSTLIQFLVAIILIMLYGCSGCSESALQHRAAQQQSLENREYRETPNHQIQPREDQKPRIIPQTPVADLSLSELFNQNKSAVFMVFTSDDENIYQGSGFFVSSRGIAVSNYHIFSGTFIGNELIVTDTGNEMHIKRVIEKNRELDYIIFEVTDANNIQFLRISNSAPSIGENVFAIGNPRGLSHTLSTGIVSGYRENDTLIQTSAEITRGSSGGALMNMNGEVVGITTGGFAEANLNFAINIDKLRLYRFIN